MIVSNRITRVMLCGSNSVTRACDGCDGGCACVNACVVIVRVIVMIGAI